MSIEYIKDKDETLAIVIRMDFDKKGLNYVTKGDSSFELAVHNVGKNTRYKAHITYPFQNIRILKANKIYYVVNGKAGVDLYNSDEEKVKYVTLTSGDLILLLSGGHGLDILEDSKVIEIKQGPYRGQDKDKKFLE